LPTGGSDVTVALPLSTLTSSFTAVGGTDAANVWADETLDPSSTSPASNLYHWDGVSWSPPTMVPHVLGDLVAVGSDVFAIADATSVLQVQGLDVAHATTTLLPVDSPLNEISGTAPDDVFVYNGVQLFHFDGTSWSQVRLRPELLADGILGVTPTPGLIDVVYNQSPAHFERLVRTRFWNCRPKETDCHDGVDDDCDGLVDGDDPDCPH
jgi:hypothetical protein